MHSENEGKQTLQNTTSDYLAAATRSIVGAAPIVGSLLVELVGAVIPAQRTDRIAKFASSLESRLARVERDVLRKNLSDENFCDLMEETMRQAARAVTDERRRYLAALLANSVAPGAVSHIESKHILRVLGELNDVEVIWLRSYLDVRIGADDHFRSIHADILEPVSAHAGSEQDEIDKWTLQRSYKEHLARLGLLAPRHAKNTKTKDPEFDSRLGGFKVVGYEITLFGGLLLRQIDLGDGFQGTEGDADERKGVVVESREVHGGLSESAR